MSLKAVTAGDATPLTVDELEQLLPGAKVTGRHAGEPGARDRDRLVRHQGSAPGGSGSRGRPCGNAVASTTCRWRRSDLISPLPTRPGRRRNCPKAISTPTLRLKPDAPNPDRRGSAVEPKSALRRCQPRRGGGVEGAPVSGMRTLLSHGTPRSGMPVRKERSGKLTARSLSDLG